jgi:hypothetical protein
LVFEFFIDYLFDNVTLSEYPVSSLFPFFFPWPVLLSYNWPSNPEGAFMHRFMCCIAVGWILLALAPKASAVTVLVDVPGQTASPNTAGPGIALGQSFNYTTPASAETDIIFNFLFSGSATAPVGSTGYLLSQAYSGLPSALSSSTPGYLGQATASSSGLYSFGSAVTLSAGTEYYFYENNQTGVEISTTETGYSGGSLYSNQITGTDFVNDTASFGSELSASFEVQGTPLGSISAVPEPSQCVPMAALGACLVLRFLSRTMRRRVPAVFGNA